MSLVFPKAMPLFGRRILIADDSPAARVILKGILERAGASVTDVADGEDAVRQVRDAAHAYEAVVLDLVMERQGGLEAARRIRASSGVAQPAIILMSASAGEEERGAARDARAFAEILEKPLAQDATLRIVGSAIGITAVVHGRPTEAAGPSFRGCDIQGALERCGGDRGLLLDLHRRLLDETGRRLSVAGQAFRGRLYRIAGNELHRLRGDLLNLGFHRLADRVKDLQADAAALVAADTVSPGGTVPTGFMIAGERMADALPPIEHELARLISAVRQLPAMSAGVPGASPVKARGLDAEAMVSLVAELERDDLAALRVFDPNARVLPERYLDSVDQDFRARLARLDFPGALRLLDACDRPLAKPAAGSGYRILVVDDVPSAVLVLYGMIESVGRVRFALTGERALAIAREWVPDLVIADVHLGGMSGIELCRALKADPATAEAAVMMVSADNEVAVEVEGLTAGAADFISKPLVPARVIGRVNAQLASLRRVSSAAAAIVGDVSSAALGFITATHAGAVIDVSPRIVRELPGVGAGWGGRALRELFDPAFGPEIDRMLKDIAAHGRAAPSEGRLLGVEGATIPVRLVGWSAPGATSRVAWLSVEDRRDRLASERRRLEEELTRTVGVMAGGMAHEFNNLLNVAIGNVELVVEGAGIAGPHRERLARASDALCRAADISRRLGDFGLRGERAAGPDSLDRLLDQVWPFLAGTVPDGIVVLRERAQEEVMLEIDSRGLRSAISNLLQNAYDALPNGGQVTVRTQVRREPGADGPIVALEVEDSGPGMSEAVRLRAFEPFFTTRAPAHTGLGLTQVRGFVQRNRGTIEIRSAPGAGTVVHIDFDA